MRPIRHPHRFVLGLIAALAAAPLGIASAQRETGVVVDTATSMPVPAPVHALEAHEVVERIIGQRHDLLLSDAQFKELQSLHRAVREERAIYESTGRSKPPMERPVWVTTPEQALQRAFTILTPQQWHHSLMLFETARKPSA